MVSFRSVWLSLCVVLALEAPALAATTPTAVQALSSAGTPVGSAIAGPNGQSFLDAAGNPVTVTGLSNTPGQATAVSLASTLKMPIGDLLAQANAVGISLPLMMTGTVTTVTRSDGGTEHVFSFTSPTGDTYVFLADQTGPNVYGVRIADVHPNGQAQVFTAHGLNGNFTSPPWYLSQAAQANYWENTQTAQLFTPAPDPGSSPAALASAGVVGNRAHLGTGVYSSDYSVGNTRVTLTGSRKRVALASVRTRF